VTDATDSTGPAVAAPVITTANASDQGSNTWSWLTWPIGGAALLIAGILLLGRQIRQKFGSIAIGATEKPAPAAGSQVEVIAEAEPELQAAAEPEQQIEVPEPVIGDVDYELDDTDNSEAISLDADLDAGTGLQGSPELDVAQDFGFAASDQIEAEVDHVFPDDTASNADTAGIDSIPPVHEEVAPSIADSEPVSEDDYDLSMIVDATKQHIDDTQLTVQDLQAVPLDPDSSDSYSISDGTLASNADLEALEQDYQEEFTQTLAINDEIEKAAQELAAQLEDDIDDDDPTADEPILTIEDPGLDPTAEMPARQPEDELTAEMPARTIDNDITAEIPEQTSAAEVTAELAANVAAENDDLAEDRAADDAVTTKLVAGGNEPTVEMQIETVIANLEDDDQA
jgi:hypothetical protein